MNERLGAAFAWAGIAGAASYALQRLYSAWSGEVTYAQILAQEHVPYSWRAVLALFHAVLVGLVVALACRDAAAWLRPVPVALAVVGLLAAGMAVIP